MTKFTSCFPDNETVDDWCAYWAEGLAGVTGAQIAYGLRYTTQRSEWPPTLAEFKACCKALPNEHLVLPEKPAVDREKVHATIKAIKGMLTTSRPPGKWWAEEIVAKRERGEPVPYVALKMAEQGLAAATPFLKVTVDN